METTELKTTKIKTGARGAYSYAWKILKDKFISLFLVFLILLVVGMPMGVFQDVEDISFIQGVLMVFALAYNIFILNPISYGAKWVHLKIVRGAEFEVKETFDGFTNYLNVVLTALLKGVIVGFGFAFFIIPGIIFACRLAFVPYLVMDKKLDPVKAVEESWRLTKGYGWTIFRMGILSFLLFIAGLMVLIFGVVVSIIWTRTAFATIYEAVLEERGEKDELVVA